MLVRPHPSQRILGVTGRLIQGNGGAIGTFGSAAAPRRTTPAAQALSSPLYSDVSSTGGYGSTVGSPAVPSYAQTVTPRGSAVAPTTVGSAPSASGFDVSTDPSVQLAKARANQGNADIDALLRRGLSSLFVNYGSPGLASQLSQYGYTVSPTDVSAAQANYNAGNATLARLDQQHSLGRQAVTNNLAARGLIRSGDLGYQLGQQDTQYGNGVYDALQNVLNQAFNLQQGAISQRNSLQDQITQAMQSAWQNFINQPQIYAQPPPSDQGGGGGGDQSPPPPPVPSYTYAGSASNLQSPAARAVIPTSQPFAVKVSANKSGASANKRQGVFSVH